MNELQALATIGGSLALVGGLVGSAIGIGLAATAGVATLSEDSGELRNVVVLASLPMTQTFYGLIILIIILTVVIPDMPTSGSAGLAIAAIGTMGGAAELFSAIF